MIISYRILSFLSTMQSNAIKNDDIDRSEIRIKAVKDDRTYCQYLEDSYVSEHKNKVQARKKSGRK